MQLKELGEPRGLKAFAELVELGKVDRSGTGESGKFDE